MGLLRGVTAGVDLAAIERQARSLTAEYTAEKQLFDTLRADRSGANVGAPPASLDGSTAVLQKESANPHSRIDWTRFEKLKKASPAELDDAMAKYRAIDQLDLEFSKFVGAVFAERNPRDLEKLSMRDAQLLYQHLGRLVLALDKIEAGLASAGECAATANFPKDQLKLIGENAAADIEALIEAKGDKVTEGGIDARSGYVGSGGGWAANYNKDPSPDMLPASKLIPAEQLATAESAAAKLGELLKSDALGGALAKLIENAGDRGGELAGNLRGLAQLTDEAQTGNYPFCENRQEYRSRIRCYAPPAEVNAATAQMNKAIEGALAAEDPIGALGKALGEEALRELKLGPQQTKGWKPNAVAIQEILAGHGLVALRGLNERVNLPGKLGVETRAMILDMTQAFVEGRFESWRNDHPTSKKQVSALSEAQVDVWLADFSIAHETKNTKDEPVTLTTSQPRGVDLLWATKVGGPSYGFDIGPQALLGLLSNIRNDFVLVSDPRWPNFAGRTNIRLVHEAATDKPVLFCEGPSYDFPYPGKRADVDAAVLKHAIGMAKEMNLPLYVSGLLMPSVKELKVGGKLSDREFVLFPSRLWEAASVFGLHDEPQTGTLIRRASRIPFHVELG
jgi:hypothetical protein